MPLSQNISRPQDITIADVTKSSFFIDSHHGDGMMDLFDQVPEKLLLQQKQKAAAHISGLMGVGGPSGLKDHSEVAVGVADDMDVGDWDLNLNDNAGGFQLDLGDVLMDANNEMLDATAAGDSSMDIEVGRDGAANRSFSPLNPARDSLASFEANKNGENGDADDFVGQDNILDNAPDQNFSFELGGGEPADAAAREEAAAEQVFNAEPADQSNADFDLPIMDMDQR